MSIYINNKPKKKIPAAPPLASSRLLRPPRCRNLFLFPTHRLLVLAKVGRKRGEERRGRRDWPTKSINLSLPSGWCPERRGEGRRRPVLLVVVNRDERTNEQKAFLPFCWFVLCPALLVASSRYGINQFQSESWNFDWVSRCSINSIRRPHDIIWIGIGPPPQSKQAEEGSPVQIGLDSLSY